MSARTAVGLFSVVLLGACASTAPPQSAPPAAKPPTTNEPSSADAPPPDAGAPLAAATPSDRPPGTIFRSEIDRALARGPGYLLYELGPEPFRLSGTFVGWEITKVFPDEPGLCEDGCDLMVGDIILSVNGDRLETPQALSNMIDALPRTDTLTIKSIRNEKRRVATYTLREG
jgi:S1-C subfamily serine protease